MRRNTAYWDYLKLDRLLLLQGGVEGDESRLAPDELHFIVSHQVHELWFKLVLKEVRLGRDHLSAPRVPEEKVPYVVHHLRRACEIFRLLTEQVRVLETLIPQDFLDFRDKLMPASGFQSFQMREIELLLGLSEDDRAAGPLGDPMEEILRLAQESPGGDFVRHRVTEARRQPTLRAALLEWLHRTPIQGSGPGDEGDAEVVDAFLADYLAAVERSTAARWSQVQRAYGPAAAEMRWQLDETLGETRAFLQAVDLPEEERARARRVRAGVLFIESYRELPLLAWPRLLLDTVVELEQLLVVWRQRHARMAERLIGRRTGTGGTAGVDYLDQTARPRIFRELWAVRTLLLPRAAVPPLRNPESYGFAR